MKNRTYCFSNVRMQCRNCLWYLGNNNNNNNNNNNAEEIEIFG